MAINKYKNHLLIISEDDAYKDIAQGKDRVFVLCGKTNAERVKADLGSGKAESIGKKLAESCRTYSEQAESPWYCEQLKQNQNELNRLVKIVRPWLVGV